MNIQNDTKIKTIFFIYNNSKNNFYEKGEPVDIIYCKYIC